jgi:hypothetical protein
MTLPGINEGSNLSQFCQKIIIISAVMLPLKHLRHIMRGQASIWRQRVRHRLMPRPESKLINAVDSLVHSSTERTVYSFTHTAYIEMSYPRLNVLTWSFDFDHCACVNACSCLRARARVCECIRFWGSCLLGIVRTRLHVYVNVSGTLGLRNLLFFNLPTCNSLHSRSMRWTVEL